MSKVNIKSIPENHIDRINALLVANENGAMFSDIVGFIPRIEDVKRHAKRDPDFDSNLFLGAYSRTELVGSILGIHRPWKKGREKTGFIKWIFVKRTFQRRGIGTLLMKECEKKLHFLGCTLLEYGSCSPLYLFPGVHKEDHTTRCFLKTLGWKEISHRISLNVTLSEVDIDFKEMENFLKGNKSLLVGTANEKHKTQLFNFIEQEFSHSWAMESLPALEGVKNTFCCFLADKETGSILGFSTVNASNPNWFGPMGIKAEKQKAGLGCLLLRYSIIRAKQYNLKRLVFPWVNDTEKFYYRSLGTKGDRLVFLKYEKSIL